MRTEPERNRTQRVLSHLWRWLVLARLGSADSAINHASASSTISISASRRSLARRPPQLQLNQWRHQLRAAPAQVPTPLDLPSPRHSIHRYADVWYTYDANKARGDGVLCLRTRSLKLSARANPIRTISCTDTFKRHLITY